MGAKACMGGRAYLYGLAAAGEEGAYRSLNLLKEEVQNNMILLGCTKVEDIKSDRLRKV
jgi:isopentenyl diphosphate isomerase/L-lactate dehydrogenase-like FMN-dependent dehydrogenase